jgi:membrane peptidoglycan carboxypeptidase
MKKKRKRRHRIRKTILGLLAILLCMVLGAGTVWGMRGYGMYQEAISEKPLDERVEEIRNAKDFTSYSELPPFYVKATVSAEDHRFFDHWGIDLIAIGRAVWTDIKAMSFVQGGSTITQQLAKNLLFTQEKKMERKAAEVFAALEIEEKYTKEEIFELYANTAYFGSGYYGIYQAAMGYFGKKPMELTEYESAMLAGIPNAPSAYAPNENEELAVRRVKQVLKSMVRHKVITQEEADKVERSALRT